MHFGLTVLWPTIGSVLRPNYLILTYFSGPNLRNYLIVFKFCTQHPGGGGGGLDVHVGITAL